MGPSFLWCVPAGFRSDKLVRSWLMGQLISFSLGKGDRATQVGFSASTGIGGASGEFFEILRRVAGNRSPQSREREFK